MKILALEFSSPQRSVAVVSLARKDELNESQISSTTGRMGTRVTRPSEVSISEVIETASGNTMKPLGMVEETLKQVGLEREQIECLAVGLGPGSYTGIRLAIALAQGWQLARDVKLLGISSAECIAVEAQADGFTGKVCVVIDAQRNEFYVAGYELGSGEHREISPLRLATLPDVRELETSGETLIGPDVTRWFPGGHAILPRAATLGRLAMTRGDFVAGEKLEPIYLRETAFVKAPPPRVLREH
jgi:tRNA threonylcarbamoyl adenosine modification protein YeaZ